MNKLKFLALFIIILSSCGGAEKAMQRRLDKVHLGMSIPDFRDAIGKTSLVYLGEDYTCYKLQKSRVKYGHGYVYATRFFYFKDGELWKIDEGERAVDYRIKVDEN